MTTGQAIKAPGDGLAALAEFQAPEANDAIVRAGVATFLEVGEALGQIHAGKQYRELGFASFEAYCRDAAGHGRSWGYRLMVAAKSVANRQHSASPPANEWQARARPKAKPAEPVTVTYDAWSDVLPPIEDSGTPLEADPGALMGHPAEDSAPKPIDDDLEDGQIYWEAAGPVQRYLDKLDAVRDATTDLLRDPGDYARYDPTARQLTVAALRTTRAKMFELMRALGQGRA